MSAVTCWSFVSDLVLYYVTDKLEKTFSNLVAGNRTYLESNVTKHIHNNPIDNIGADQGPVSLRLKMSYL